MSTPRTGARKQTAFTQFLFEEGNTPTCIVEVRTAALQAALTTRPKQPVPPYTSQLHYYSSSMTHQGSQSENFQQLLQQQQRNEDNNDDT
ncbi:hypothetical protein WN944_004769 [Citrus x changshan-huyou]|uniref:Uncharacterized protein n=1 Tax=Citrus x changshan-huyou TaxID=2935761 RepID=A0AAP0QGM2_9ROSI